MLGRIVPELKLDLSLCGRNQTADAIYHALVGWLKSSSPELNRNCALVAERNLAEQLGVDRATIHKVYARLSSEGWLSRAEGGRSYRLEPRRRTAGVPSIGLILPMPFSEYYQSATEYGDRHLKIYYGMVDRAMELGFNIAPLLFPPAGSPEAAVQAAIDEITFKYAGIIHLGERGCYPDIPLRRLFDRQDIPQISIDCETGRPWIGSVALDPDSVAHMAYNLFREYGHSRICLVYHALDYRRECSYMMIDRESVTAAFRKTKIDFGCVSELVTNGDRFDARFDKALSGLLASRDAPTAFWCRNDVGAMEIIKRLVGAGYEVPGDFSVLGFGDQSVAKSCVPALTTLRNQLYEIGSTAVSRLIDCIRHGLDGAGCVVRIPPSLVLRDSVGPKSRPFAKESSSETGNIAFI